MKHEIMVSRLFEEREELDSIVEHLKRKNIAFGVYRSNGLYYIRRKAYSEDYERADKIKQYNSYFKPPLGKEKLVEDYK